MVGPIGDVLQRFELLLSQPPAQYDALIDAFGSLKVPANVSAADLGRVYATCYRLLRIEPANPPIDLERDLPERQAAHLTACARDIIERSMYDAEASTRRWIARSRQRFIDRGQPVPAEVTDEHLPARLDVPWDVPTAAERSRPFLEDWEQRIGRDPACHFRFCWNVMRNGYPVFQDIIGRWTKSLEARSLGVPGTAEAMAVAGNLYDKSNAAVAMSWLDCETDLLPMLDHNHAMVAAGAARHLGALYAVGVLEKDARAPALGHVLLYLRDRSKHRAAACGGFICGYDAAGGGLSALATDHTLLDSGFDLDQWVLDVLAAEKREIYLPNAQAFWFYVHEHYAANPAFALQLIDIGRAWVAMMCATEINEPVAGMQAVLERLAADQDQEVAAPSQAHLARHY